MMNSGSSGSELAVDQTNDAVLDLDTWIDELITDDQRNCVVDSGVDAMPINQNFPTQPNTNAITGGTVLRGGSSANKSQSGIAEIMAVSSLAANGSTATLPRSGQILSAAPNFVPNPVAQSSRTSRTTDLSQYQPVQPSQPFQTQPIRQQVLKLKAIQQPQMHSSMEQSNIMFGHQNNQTLLPSEHQLRPCPRPMVNSQTGHLQNQQALWQQSSASQLQQQQQQLQLVQPIQNFQQNLNKMQLQFPQPSGSSNNLIPEDGWHRFQGFATGDGQRKPQEQQQGNVANALLAASGLFRAPSEFPSPAAWSEYAFRQISQMKDRYLTELLIMHRNAKQLCIQERGMPAATKYETVKKFLEKMIAFLSLPTVDMIPKNQERVYNYMNLIVNYLHSFRNKNGAGSSQHPQLLVHQPPQLQPNGTNIKMQYNPQQNLSQGIANLETNMLNFNQNFPSRRPQQARMVPSSSVNNGSFQMVMDQRSANPVLRIGSFNGVQPNVLSTTQKSSGLLTTTTATGFQSRQLNNQPAVAAHQKLSSEKLKQPMQKVNEVAMSPLGSRMVNQFQYSPQFSLPSAVKPINPQSNQHAASASVRSSWNPVSSSRVDANNVLSPQSIARSPFLLATSSTPNSHAEKPLSSGVSSLSTAESKKPETPIMTVQSGDLPGIIIKDKVPEMGAAPRTPTTSSMDSPSTEKSQEPSQELNDPHLRLIAAVKSLSSKALSSSLNDICSAKKAINSIPYYGEPTYSIPPYKEMEANFLLEYDQNEQEDESGFPFEYENEPERNLRRKLSVTSVDRSSPDFSDLDSFDEFVCEEWDMDSTGTSMNKRPKIKCKNGAILEEMKEINSKLLETSLEVCEDNISLHGSYEGTIVRCLYRNVSFPELLSLQGGASSGKRPEFLIELLVPVDYPASSPLVLNSRCNVQGELWGMLFKETVSRFERSVRELTEKMSIGDMARHWDACARSVITELAQQRGGKSFGATYGRWESCT